MGIEWVPLRRAGSTCALSRWPSSGREAKVRDLAGLPEGCSASNKAVAQLPSGLIHASRASRAQSSEGRPPAAATLRWSPGGCVGGGPMPGQGKGRMRPVRDTVTHHSLHTKGARRGAM